MPDLLELIVSSPQGGAVARLEDLAGRARAFMEAAKAENSRRAYRSDWRHFECWCRDHGVVSLPAAPETVALYLTALAADHKPASLQRKLTSITKAHQAAGFPTPASMQNAVVSETLKGIRRSLGTAQPGKEPLFIPDILNMLDALDDGLLGCRDRPLLLVGFRRRVPALGTRGPGRRGCERNGGNWRGVGFPSHRVVNHKYEVLGYREFGVNTGNICSCFLGYDGGRILLRGQIDHGWMLCSGFSNTGSPISGSFD